MKNELISVIMGVYNIPSKEILKLSIDSILNQSYKNIEFIVVDDGSTNDTLKWVKELTKNDKRVIILKNKVNQGTEFCLNKALKIAKGKYVAVQDGDDYCSLERLKKELNFLKKHSEYQLVSSNANCFDENGIWGERIFDEEITEKSFLFTSPVQHGSILTYKECYDRVGGYKTENYVKRNEDYDLFMRMYASGIKMHTIQEKLYYYRVDELCYSKRKFKYRINEAIVRAKGYKLLGLYPKGIIYVLKPVLVGLLPVSIIKKIHRKKRKVKHE